MSRIKGFPADSGRSIAGGGHLAGPGNCELGSGFQKGGCNIIGLGEARFRGRANHRWLVHIKGRVHLGRDVPPGRGAGFDLTCTRAATVLETQHRKVVYEGVIFDVSDADIVERPAVLRSAFGYYTYVVLEKETGKVTIGTDRLGFSPLYYSLAAGDFRFSSSIALLKGELPRVTPDMDAWDELLLLGDIIGEKTVVKEIQRLQWGREISIEDGRVKFTSVWDPESPPPCEKNVYIARNNALLDEAMRLAGSVKRNRVVALTGGQDSRRIAVAMQVAGLEAMGATQEVIGNQDKDEDTLIAQDVARALGFRHLRLDAPEPEAMREDSRTKDYWGGYESSYHAWAVNLMRGLPAGSLIFDGIAGDVTVNGHFFRAHPEAIGRFDDVDYLAKLVCGEAKSRVDQRLVSAPVFERVRAELSRLPASDHRLTYYYILNHTRRNIGTWIRLFSLNGHVPCTPYLYYPFFLQSLSLSSSHHLDAWMQNECIRALRPHVASIPSTRDPVPSAYLLDKSALARKYLAPRTPRVALHGDLGHYLPGMAVRQYAHEVSSYLPFASLKSRWGWASDIAERFSGFLHWVQEKESPPYPAGVPSSFVAA